MQFAFDKLGRWAKETAFEVTAERIKAYAAAINDTNRAHLEARIAPPLFAVVPAMMGGATRAADMVVVSEVEGYDIRKVHGEQDIFFLKPIVPGMVLHSRAAPVGVQVKSSGTTVVARSETRDDKGEMINYQYWTVFFRGVSAPASAGERAPSHDVPPRGSESTPPAFITYRVDRDQSNRYAEASGDRGPYHLDEAAAKAAGFPAVILHGLCTMAFASRALIETVCEGDSTRLRRFAVRFTRPGFPGREINTRIWPAGQRDDTQLYEVEVAQASSEPIIKLAVAEVSR